jgi:glycosyltransferase involved in cell wall biosynthesis
LTSSKPHILIIPSEEFLLPDSHLAGIFQLHQANALIAAGFRVGVISVRLALSAPMIFRAAFYRLAGRAPGNSLDGRSIRELASLLRRKLTEPESFVTCEETGRIAVVRAEGFYFARPSPSTDHVGWIRAGLTAFDAYCDRFGRPDVLHAHNLNPAGLLAHRISRRHDIPFVVTEHSTFWARGLIPRMLMPRLRKAASAATTLAAVSPQLGQLLEKELQLDQKHIQWIPNVIDPFVVSAPAAASTSTRDRFEFLCVGNLIPIKNQAVLLEAFQRAFDGHREISLRIGGDGPLEFDLKQLAEALGLRGQVEFLGRLSREQVVQELDRCDALVLPSTIETFGVVLIEALVRGKPVVATRCGGPESFVAEGDGIVVSRDDVAGLADALRTMRMIAADYDANDLRGRALARFGPQKLVDNLTALYDRALAHA